jgi:DNA-binding CsgD family transcriptional regulator
MTIRDLLELQITNVITTAEHDVLLLRIKGLSQRQTALALDISRGAVRDRLKNGDRKIALHRRKAAA